MQKLFQIFLYLFFIVQGFSQTDRIVFSSDRYGNYDIFSIKPDGTDLQQLTKHSARDAWPKWSPDGRKIIFCSEREGKNQIFTMNADGSELRNLSNNRFNELDPLISPNGKLIAFITKASGSYQLHVMNIDGSGRRKLTDKGPFNGRPDWSPDSRKLVFISPRSGTYEVYRINVDGTNEQVLTNFKTEVGAPAWSKHGYYILFHGHEGGVDYIFQMTPNGKEIKKIDCKGDPNFLARWNGFSKKIVFVSNRDGNHELYVKDLASGTETQLTHSRSSDSMPDWFTPSPVAPSEMSFSPTIPGNYRLAFTSYRGGSPDIFLMRPDGSVLRQLTDSEDSNSFPKDAGDGLHVNFLRSTAESAAPQSPFQVNLLDNRISELEEVPIVPGALESRTSPDGQFISYSKQMGDYFEFFLYDTETKNHQQITDHTAQDLPAQIRISFWSHDSRKLAYLSGEDYYNLYLRVFDLEQGTKKTITDRGYMFSGVVWLKDNDSFIVNIKIRGKTTYELWRIDLDGLNLKQLTDNPGRGSVHPDLSPDGNWIAFESGRDMDDGEIYLMRPDGSQQTRITYHRTYDGRPVWIKLKKK